MLIKPMMNGFMGSGKSTIGKHVAGELGIPFLDLDDEMVASPNFEGLSIPAFIEKYDGKAPPFPEFRKRETLVLEDVVTANMDISHVLSVGGGTYESPQIRENHRLIQQGEYLPFFIDTPIDDIIQRKKQGAQGVQHRVDLNEKVLRRLHTERYMNYKMSIGNNGLIIKNTGDVSSSVAQILNHLSQYKK